MEPFTQLTAIAAPIELRNVNTDMIFPARFMRKPRDEAYPLYMFHDRRFQPDGTEDPDFVLNQPRYAGASILLARKNFGCGSSREHAVWALKEFGIRSIIAPSFGAIFYNNCIRNGVLPIVLSDGMVSELAAQVEEDPPSRLIQIDLPQGLVTAPNGDTYAFDIDPGPRDMLLKGLDMIGLTLQHKVEIDAFQEQDRDRRPWIYAALNP